MDRPGQNADGSPDAGTGHVYQMLEPLLPIRAVEIHTKEIDTVNDYENAGEVGPESLPGRRMRTEKSERLQNKLRRGRETHLPRRSLWDEGKTFHLVLPRREAKGPLPAYRGVARGKL